MFGERLVTVDKTRNNRSNVTENFFMKVRHSMPPAVHTPYMVFLKKYYYFVKNAVEVR